MKKEEHCPLHLRNISHPVKKEKSHPEIAEHMQNTPPPPFRGLKDLGIDGGRHQNDPLRRADNVAPVQRKGWRVKVYHPKLESNKQNTFVKWNVS